MWMNQSDIQIAYSRNHECPNVRKGIRLLYRLMRYVNANSDGWAYFHAPGKACEPLMDLLRAKAGNLWHDTHGRITDAELKKVITPIKRMATIQREKQKKYGNTFEFDVEAALKEAEPPPPLTPLQRQIASQVKQLAIGGVSAHEIEEAVQAGLAQS